MADKAFITGATGFLGSAIARALHKAGYEVQALSRSKASADRARAQGYTAVPGDLNETGTWLDQACDAQVIVHAAQVRPGMRLSKSWLDASRQTRNHGLKHLLEVAQEGHACRSFIYTSGIAAAGDHGDDWIEETAPRKSSAMGDYHHEGEALVLEAAQHGVPVCALRPGFVYGADGSFAKFFLAEAAKGVYRYPGTGRNFISWVQADDMAQAYVAAASKPPIGQVVHLVDDQPLRMDEFALQLLDAFGGGRPQKVPRFVVSLFAGGPLAEMLTGSYRVRNTRARQLLGWQPRYPTFAQGIVDVVREYQGHKPLGGAMQWGAK